MKIIEPNVTEITDFEGVDNFYKAVARAARICYASDKTTGDKELCERLIKSGHFSPFEHAIVYYECSDLTKRFFEINPEKDYAKIMLGCLNNSYVIKFKGTRRHIAGYTDFTYYAINGRVLVEEILKFYPANDTIKIIDEILSGYSDFIVKHNFKSFIVDTSIGCTREMNRHHDNFYICEQSTRYCNFSKDKFDNEIAFNKPYWYDEASIPKQNAWEFAMRQAEYNYLNNQYNFDIDEIRGMLPLDTHTRAIYTATLEEWNHIIDLRLKGTTGKPHGDIKIIAEKINQIINK